MSTICQYQKIAYKFLLFKKLDNDTNLITL